jgi:hypothetical protein
MQITYMQIGAVVGHKSPAMVEALYNMHQVSK